MKLTTKKNNQSIPYSFTARVILIGNTHIHIFLGMHRNYLRLAIIFIIMDGEDESSEFSRSREYDRSLAEMIYHERKYNHQGRANDRLVYLCKVAERTSLVTRASIRTIHKLEN